MRVGLDSGPANRHIRGHSHGRKGPKIANKKADCFHSRLF